VYSRESTRSLAPTAAAFNGCKPCPKEKGNLYSEARMASDRVTLKIPRPLYENLKRVVEGTGFRSVNEFVVHVLRDLVVESGGAPSALTPREVEALRTRLRTLGYL